LTSLARESGASGQGRPLPPAFRALEYWWLRYRRTWRGTVVISVVNPLLFLTATGIGMGRLVNRHASGSLQGHAYLAFVVPGLLAAAVMQTTSIEAGGPVYTSARDSGSYRAAMATPLSPADILTGHLMFMGLRVLLTAVAFTAVGAAFGAVSLARAPLLVLAAFLCGMAFATPIAAWAVSARTRAGLGAVYRFVIMPMYMFSGTFFAVSQLPPPLRVIIEVTPLWHGVDLCRTLAFGDARPAETLIHVTYLAALAVAGFILARRNYARNLRT
jgi:ABC-type polysaccharide/polyol phosphate export permease